jgi:hypothetical protein
VVKVFEVVHEQALPLEAHLVPTQDQVIICLVKLLRELKKIIDDKDSYYLGKDIADCVYRGIVERFRRYQMQEGTAGLMCMLLEPRAYQPDSSESRILGTFFPSAAADGGLRDKFIGLCSTLQSTYGLELVPSGPLDDDEDLLPQASVVEIPSDVDATPPAQKRAKTIEFDIETNTAETAETQLDEFKRQLGSDMDAYVVPEKARNRPAHYNLHRYFKKHGSNMKVLGRIARMLLCIPATSAIVERLFSRAGWILSPRRSRMTSDNFRYMMHLGFDAKKTGEVIESSVPSMESAFSLDIDATES